MRRGERHLLPRERHAFAHRHARVGERDDALLDHARQDLVAALQRGDGVTVGPLSHRRLRQRHEQCCLRQVDARRLLAEIGQRRGAHALEVAAERRERQIEREDLILRIPLLELHRPHHLEQLGDDAARARLQQARHLHGQRRAARDDAPVARKLHARARHRQRIDAEMIVETLVLIRFEQREIARRHVAHVRLDAPVPVLGEIGAQQMAAAIRHLRRQIARASCRADWRHRRRRARRRGREA